MLLLRGNKHREKLRKIEDRSANRIMVYKKCHKIARIELWVMLLFMRDIELFRTKYGLYLDLLQLTDVVCV